MFVIPTPKVLSVATKDMTGTLTPPKNGVFYSLFTHFLVWKTPSMDHRCPYCLILVHPVSHVHSNKATHTVYDIHSGVDELKFTCGFNFCSHLGTKFCRHVLNPFPCLTWSEI